MEILAQVSAVEVWAQVLAVEEATRVESQAQMVEGEDGAAVNIAAHAVVEGAAEAVERAVAADVALQHLHARSLLHQRQHCHPVDSTLPASCPKPSLRRPRQPPTAAPRRLHWP